MTEDSVYIFEARLLDYGGVACTIAVRASQTLEHLHRALRRAFNWYDDHLYSFWLSGVHCCASALPLEPGARYPKVLDRTGTPPAQYK